MYMKSIIRRILRENVENNHELFLEKLSKKIKKPPYFKEMKHYGVDNFRDYEKLFSYIFNQDVDIKLFKNSSWLGVYNSDGMVIYDEELSNEYDVDEDSSGVGWEITLYEDSRFPEKWTHIVSNILYTEETTIREFNENGDVIYLKDGDVIKMDRR